MEGVEVWDSVGQKPQLQPQLEALQKFLKHQRNQLASRDTTRGSRAAKAFRAELVKQGVLEEPKPVDPNFTSEVPGVCWDKASKKWQVLLTPNKATKGPNKRIHGGFFTEKAAAESKALELAKLHGLERKVTAVGRFSELPIFGAKVPYPGVTWERRSQKWHARCRSFRAKPKDHSEAELEASHKKAVVWRKKQEKERVKAKIAQRLAADTSGRLLSRSNRQNQSALHLAVILGASNSLGARPLDYAKRRNDVEAVQSITAGEALVAEPAASRAVRRSGAELQSLTAEEATEGEKGSASWSEADELAAGRQDVEEGEDNARGRDGIGLAAPGLSTELVAAVIVAVACGGVSAKSLRLCLVLIVYMRGRSVLTRVLNTRDRFANVERPMGGEGRMQGAAATGPPGSQAGEPDNTPAKPEAVRRKEEALPNRTQRRRRAAWVVDVRQRQWSRPRGATKPKQCQGPSGIEESKERSLRTLVFSFAMLGALPRRHGRCGARGGIYLHWILGHVEMHFVPTTGNAFIGIEPELVALKPSLLLAIPLRRFAMPHHSPSAIRSGPLCMVAVPLEPGNSLKSSPAVVVRAAWGSDEGPNGAILAWRTGEKQAKKGKVSQGPRQAAKAPTFALFGDRAQAESPAPAPAQRPARKVKAKPVHGPRVRSVPRSTESGRATKERELVDLVE
ncbi:unnamed protein product [Durusdinium trenchii]|uniref:AP2/ERF domain-containing protein n=1 Tax=Durusdinium trenchii TaxID=1381693 RepID=A0ABP0IJ92_9DINO